MKALLVLALILSGCGSGSTGVGLVDPSAGLTTHPPPSEEPLATEDLGASSDPIATKDPPAAPDLAVSVTKRPGSVRQGRVATVAVKTTKNATCDIDVQYYSGSSNAKGLETRTADAKGAVSWKWLVGRKTTTGKWPIVITCALGDRSGSVGTDVTVK